jgi:hypothetical protein
VTNQPIKCIFDSVIELANSHIRGGQLLNSTFPHQRFFFLASIRWMYFSEPHIILFRRELTDEVKREKEDERKKKMAEENGQEVMLGGRRDRVVL